MTKFKPIFGVIIINLLILASCNSRSTVAVGEIVYLEGDVTLNGRKASVGDAARDGDVLVTGPESYAEVEFGEYRVLRAYEKAVLTLDASEDALRLDQGGLAVVQSKARFLSREKSWTVRTPTTIAAVRGTAYYINAENVDSTYFCLCNGKIHLEDTQDWRALEYEAKAHQGVRFYREGDQIVYEDAPNSYGSHHSDEAMESLADLVNVAIDWTEIP